MDGSIITWMEVLSHGWKYCYMDVTIIAWMEVLLRGWKYCYMDGRIVTWMEELLSGWKMIGGVNLLENIFFLWGGKYQRG